MVRHENRKVVNIELQKKGEGCGRERDRKGERIMVGKRELMKEMKCGRESPHKVKECNKKT